MKTCPNCNAQIDDGAAFCTSCGVNVAAAAQAAPQSEPQPAPQPAYAPQGAYAQPYVDPADHTGEFDPQDISDNKVFAMAVYLLGVIGIIVALLAARDSKYVAFHLRQAMKFVIVELLTVICTAILCWTIIVPIAAGIFLCVLGVIEIICFFQVCSGKAKEPAIIKSLKFLK